LTVNWDGTSKALEYLRALNEGRAVPRAACEAIARDSGYLRLLQRRILISSRLAEPGQNPQADADALSPDQFARCLEDRAAGRAFTGHEFLQNLLTAFDQARGRLAEHVAALERVRALTPAALEGEVRNYLPPEARLDTTVYILAETHPAAYTFDGDIFISFFPLKLSDGQLTTIAGPLTSVLGHELHHIGFESVSPQADLLENAPQTAGEVALGLLGGLLGEGMATMLFTPLDPAQRDDGEVTWGQTAADLSLHYAALEEVLGDLIAADGMAGGFAASRLAELMRKTFHRFFSAYRGKHQPIVYVLGHDMCRVVAEAFGAERLVGLLREPGRFLAAYDEASARCGGHRFPPSLVRATAAIATKAAASG